MIIMRKAAMPVPYIIALILGVIVVVVLAYWFVTSGGKGGNIAKEAECTARKVEFCATQTVTSEADVAKVCSPDWKTDIENFCERIIPGWKKVS